MIRKLLGKLIRNKHKRNMGAVFSGCGCTGNITALQYPITDYRCNDRFSNFVYK